MNKYFYPIYKMKIKPWIKYWLLKKLNESGESTLKVVTLSSGTLKKVDKSKSLSIKEYYGNTIQNGTPTPEAPVEIQTISGDNTFTINNSSYKVELGNIELCKIGEYQDRIYKENDKWYIEKNIGKVILNGTRAWTSSSAYTGYARFNCDALPETVTDNNGLNTHFIERVSQPHGGYDYLYISANSKKIYIQIQNSIASSVSDFTTWLSNNNVTVYYIKHTTVTEIITNTNLISQLNNLYEFYVQSNIVSISNNSEIQLEVLLEYYGR